MRLTTSSTATGIFAALALAAAPGSAVAATPHGGSDGVSIAVSHVSAHTDRADAALERALSMFAKSHDRAARVAYAKSRREMGRAKADVAKMRRDAESASASLRAARAQALVAAQQGENIAMLAKALRPADGRDESKIAVAARADTKGREKAIGVLTVLLTKVPEQARTGIAKALAQLSTNRGSEAKNEARTLTSKHVSNKNKRRLMSAMRTSVDGQVSASQTLALLIASDDMPAESKQGLQTAYDNVTAEHGSIVDILSRFSDRMPAFARTFVERIITQARTDAQGMRENHPTGLPAGTPGGPTAGPNGGPGATVPAGPLAGSQFGPPSA